MPGKLRTMQDRSNLVGFVPIWPISFRRQAR